MTNNKPTFVRWRVMSILILASFVSYIFRYNFSAAAPATRNNSTALSATRLLTMSVRTRETKVERSRTRMCEAREEMTPDLAL